MEGNKHLTDRMTVAGVDLLAVGSSKNCQTLLKRIERESINRFVKAFTLIIHNHEFSLRYHTLTVPEEEAANCLLINGSLLVPHMSEIPLSSEVHFGHVLCSFNIFYPLSCRFSSNGFTIQYKK